MNQPLFDILLHGVIGVDYILQLDYRPKSGRVQQIEGETRQAGGEAVVCARMLAAWGARVGLFGNPIGDDSNGRLVQGALQEINGLKVFAPIVPGHETPYRVVLESPGAPPAILTRFSEDLAAASAETAELPSTRFAACGNGDGPGAPTFEAKCAAQAIDLLYWREAPNGLEAYEHDFRYALAYRGALLWCALQDWDDNRAIRFSRTASHLFCENQGEIPSLSQIEAKL